MGIGRDAIARGNPAGDHRASLSGAMMQQAFTSTTFTIEGYKVTRSMGVVRGIIVRSRSIIGNVGAALQMIVGGNITIYTQLCEKTRNDAFDLMMWHADALGANAVIGVRYDATEIMKGVTEVLCYGTAVVVELQLT
ncbi:MAG TPA: YbjQ family protein [Gemmatimonadaceae bacterium]|nr:YbjQ family protein [Gemmatimonadaceae bacterium]